jgi:hypothetical protein
VSVFIDGVMALFGLMLIAGNVSLVFTLEHIEFRILAALLALGTTRALAQVLRGIWLEMFAMVRHPSRSGDAIQAPAARI